MIQLETLVRNPFEDEKISHNNFRQFGFDHTVRLEANNPGGIYTARHAATLAAFQQYDTVLGSKTLEEAIKKGATFGLGATTTTILEAVRKLEKQVAYQFGNPSVVYLEFFPRGLTEFNNAGKGEWPSLLTRLKISTQTHSATLGAAVATEFAGYATEFSAVAGTQVTSKGNVSDLRDLLNQKRAGLAKEMFTNLLTITLNNIGNQASVKTYFDQSIVDRRQSSDSDKKGRFVVKVTDHNQDPLAGVFIHIQDERDQDILLNQRTDENGEYRSPQLPIGFYRITFKLTGFVSRTHTFEVFDDQDPMNEVQMTRE